MPASNATAEVNALPLAPSATGGTPAGCASVQECRRAVGDYFPNQTPQQLAKKKNLCQGAKPQFHSHFFTADGKFGSVDQHGEQVDDGTYEVSGSTLKIGEASFRLRIQGKTLMLKPLLTSALKQEALADPLNFHAAGWMVAVALQGHPWNRVACRTWC